jgi:hypothetical protein
MKRLVEFFSYEKKLRGQKNKEQSKKTRGQKNYIYREEDSLD